VIAGEPSFDAIGSKETPRLSRILSSYEVHLAKDAQGTQGYVFDVTYRGGYYVKGGHRSAKGNPLYIIDLFPSILI